MPSSDPGTRHPFVRPPPSTQLPLLSPTELVARRADPEPPLLLDVRATAERRFARLPDDVHIPLAELPARVGDLPKKRAIVVYDQFGGDARRAAELLFRGGFDRFAVLDGGLDAYARVADPNVGRYRVGEREFVLRQLPRPDTGCLSYFLGDPTEREAVIVDPGENVEPYLKAIRSENWQLRAIVETHTHADHLAGHAALHHATEAPIYVSRLSPAQYPHRSLAEGEALPFGARELTAIETPGHTRDHLTLRFEDKVFTGDTLLIGGCGRTDLGDGDPGLLFESLTEKLLRLPDATEVFPAHYGAHHALVDRYCSTVGVERATNEALNQGSREAFLRYMTEGWPPKPANFDRIVGANLADAAG